MTKSNTGTIVVCKGQCHTSPIFWACSWRFSTRLGHRELSSHPQNLLLQDKLLYKKLLTSTSFLSLPQLDQPNLKHLHEAHFVNRIMAVQSGCQAPDNTKSLSKALMVAEVEVLEFNNKINKEVKMFLVVLSSDIKAS